MLKKIFYLGLAFMMELCFLCGCNQTNPPDSNELWREATDENTFIVCANVTMLGRDLTAEDLAPLKVEKIIPIDGVSPRTTEYYQYIDRSELGLYSVRLRNPSDKNLRTIREFNFVDFAWRNEYDYNSNPTPSEEKIYVEVQDYWSGFLGDMVVVIDKSFQKRIFTAEDFKLSNIVSVDWYTYKEFKKGEEDEHIFHIEISDGKDKETQESLYKLEFVKKTYPGYAVTDSPGIPGERP